MQVAQAEELAFPAAGQVVQAKRFHDHIHVSLSAAKSLAFSFYALAGSACTEPQAHV